LRQSSKHSGISSTRWAGVSSSYQKRASSAAASDRGTTLIVHVRPRRSRTAVRWIGMQASLRVRPAIVKGAHSLALALDPGPPPHPVLVHAGRGDVLAGGLGSTAAGSFEVTAKK
jgi:hypothetical protein